MWACEDEMGLTLGRVKVKLRAAITFHREIEIGFGFE